LQKFVPNYTVRTYTSADYSAWNDFIAQAKNATFLFHRDFMEYHQDRFEDYSLIVEQENNWVAILPANRVGDVVFSHQGLTYGGLVFKEDLKLEKVIFIFKSLIKELYKRKVSKLILKEIPIIYCDFFSDETKYILFLLEAKLIKRDTLAVIDLLKEIQIAKNRIEGVKRGLKNQLIVKEENDFSSFWDSILIPNLINKHNAKPVHTLEEITILKQKFPKNIRQFNVYKENELIGGTTIFESKNVAHSQYISANLLKNEYGTLDYLHHYLITEVFKNKQFFDFGISNEEQGKKLNGGLSYWKESFGSKILTQDFYEVQTKNYSKLEKVII
jgi:hypothetical protein